MTFTGWFMYEQQLIAVDIWFPRDLLHFVIQFGKNARNSPHGLVTT